MDEILTPAWRIYPAAALVLIGIGLAGAGLRAARVAGGRQLDGPAGALAYLYVFRRVVVGLALVGAGAAWVGQVPWLLAVCLTIAAGELLESSYYIGVLRWGQRALPSTCLGR